MRQPPSDRPHRDVAVLDLHAALRLFLAGLEPAHRASKSCASVCPRSATELQPAGPPRFRMRSDQVAPRLLGWLLDEVVRSHSSRPEGRPPGQPRGGRVTPFTAPSARRSAWSFLRRWSGTGESNPALPPPEGGAAPRGSTRTMEGPSGFEPECDRVAAGLPTIEIGPRVVGEAGFEPAISWFRARRLLPLGHSPPVVGSRGVEPRVTRISAGPLDRLRHCPRWRGGGESNTDRSVNNRLLCR